MALQPPRTGTGLKGAGAALADARAQQDADGLERHRSEELDDACAAIEEDLEALKARFEMYFLGIERREPAREREEMKRRIAKLKGEFTRNTGLRFRIQTLHARFLSYERMWVRSAREKEEGTYRRDVLRARRHAEGEQRRAAREAARDAAAGAAATAGGPAAAPSAQPPATGAGAAHAAARPAGPDACGHGERPPAVAAGTPRGTAPPPTRAAPDREASAGARPPPPAPPGSAPAVPEAQLRALYEAFVAAKRRCNEDVSRLTYESLARTVARQIPEIVAKYKARSVELKIVVKDGRAVLKVVPRV